MYPGPCSQLAQNALFRTCKLSCLPEEGGWMQTACWELFSDSSVHRTMPGNFLGKCELAPEFMLGNFQTIFSRGGLLCSARACLNLQRGCNLRVTIYLQAEIMQALPAGSLPLGNGPLVFFQVLVYKRC